MRLLSYQHGEILVDHSASPGLPEDVARESGYDPALCREGKKFEAATLTCKHCRTVLVKNPLRTRERAHCFACNHYVCDHCAIEMRHADYVHMPFERLVEIGADHAAKTGQPLGSSPGLILPPSTSAGSNP